MTEHSASKLHDAPHSTVWTYFCPTLTYPQAAGNTHQLSTSLVNFVVCWVEQSLTNQKVTFHYLEGTGIINCAKPGTIMVEVSKEFKTIRNITPGTDRTKSTFIYVPCMLTLWSFTIIGVILSRRETIWNVHMASTHLVCHEQLAFNALACCLGWHKCMPRSIMLASEYVCMLC